MSDQSNVNKTDQATVTRQYRYQQPQQCHGLELAVIGMAGQFPGAGSIDEFWQNLSKGKESIVAQDLEALKAAGAPETLLNHPDYVNAAGVLDKCSTVAFRSSRLGGAQCASFRRLR